MSAMLALGSDSSGSPPASHRRTARRVGLLAALAAVVSWGCGQSDLPTAPSDPPPPPSSDNAIVLASVELALPAALDRGDPGDHEPFVVVRRLRPDLGPTSGGRLILTLSDASRPDVTCPSEEPEDGCATVDWSGDPADPRVPPSGVFENRLQLVLTSGVKVYFLSRTLQLAEVADLIHPNHRHTAIGGRGRQWDAVLPTDLRPGSDLELRIVLTKWQAPQVRIRVLLELVPA